ncbi:hypothetical protein D3C81_1634770 [compost metagenome]
MHIALEPRIQAQHAVLQRIGIQLAEHAVQGAGAGPQTVDFLQQLHQVGHRVETLEALTAQLEAQRPVQRAGAPTIRIDGWGRHPLLRSEHADIAQADVISGAPAEALQRLHHLVEKPRRVTIGRQHRAQALDTEQRLRFVGCIHNAIGQQ